jgi:hypothetical protein
MMPEAASLMNEPCNATCFLILFATCFFTVVGLKATHGTNWNEVMKMNQGLQTGFSMKPLSLWITVIFTMLLCTACVLPANQKPRIDLWGDPTTPAAATRTLVIRDDVGYVNVTGGEVIKFVVGDTAFAWNFNSSQDIPPFDLRHIAPPDVLINHQVLVYVAPNPLYARHRGPFWSPWPP